MCLGHDEELGVFQGELVGWVGGGICPPFKVISLTQEIKESKPGKVADGLLLGDYRLETGVEVIEDVDWGGAGLG